MTARDGGERPPIGIVLFALAMGGFAIGTTEFSAMSLLPYFSRSLGIDEPTAGHVISAYALGVVVGAPTIAVLGARLPRRTLLMGLMLVFALGNLASALAPGYGWMLGFRFVSGRPHGAYFGVASLVAASLVEPQRRSQAVARMLTGLTVATVVGVPVAYAIGEFVGWRWGFALVAVLALATVALVWRFVPSMPGDPENSPLRELGALRRPQVWLTLGIGAVGFGGIFAVYTYLATTLVAVTGVSASVVPFVLATFGAGMFVGTLVCAWAADRALMPAAGATLVWSLVCLLLYHFAAQSIWTMAPICFLIGGGIGLAAIMQTRLMDVAGDAQTLAAALNHSAFNTANAIGPLLAGFAIAAGFGWTSVGWVGAALAVGGLAIWAISWTLDRKSRRSSSADAARRTLPS